MGWEADTTKRCGVEEGIEKEKDGYGEDYSSQSSGLTGRGDGSCVKWTRVGFGM